MPGTGLVPLATSRSHVVTSADFSASRRASASFAAAAGAGVGASSASESESSDITASLSRTREAISGCVVVLKMVVRILRSARTP